MASTHNEDYLLPNYYLEFIPDLINLDDIEPVMNQPTFPDSRMNQSKTRSHTKSVIEEKTLSLFINKNNTVPKKEFLRIQLIRSFKRAIREGLNKKVPSKKLGEVIHSSLESRQSWEKFLSFVNEHPLFFQDVSKTETGPQTEGKSIRKVQSKAKSFNDIYCRDFFSGPLVLEAYSLFVELVFACWDCKVLARKFNLHPKSHRNSKNGCSECRESWTQLKSYVKAQMITDLGVIIEAREVP